MKTNVPARARLAVALAAAGCTPAPHSPPAPAAPARSPPAAEAVEPAAARLHRLLIGRYDSSAQAASDAEFRVIHLTVCPADAPELGDRVLYVEQAAAEALDKPYRQRLYVVEAGAKGPASARSRVFELRAPEAAVGACARPERPRFAAAD
ncbi:MAG TPA: CpcT/CpeT family chromophore lyase, partial [Polyangiaceae bacterium]|nr:CpcT/CpeT family chromophore lyase [Polyangiaceae bacterium]